MTYLHNLDVNVWNPLVLSTYINKLNLNTVNMTFIIIIIIIIK